MLLAVPPEPDGMVRDATTPERIATLEADLRGLQRQLEDLTHTVKANERKQDERHEQNQEVLGGIKLSVEKFSLYFGVGRYVMHAVWSLIGAGAAAAIMRYFKTG
jgi:hypothetical protein